VLRPRVLITAAIVSAWAAATGTLIYREVVVPAMSGPQVVLAAATERDYWMGVFMGNDTRVGFMHLRSSPKRKDHLPGSRFSLTARLKLSLFGHDTNLMLNGDAWRAANNETADFDFDLASGDHKMRIVGALADNRLDAQFHAAGEVTPLTFPVDSQLIFGGGIGTGALDLPILEPGEEVYVDSFDPTTMGMSRARIACTGFETVRIAGDEVEARVMEVELGGLTTRAWVTEDQETVKASTPFGLTLKKVTPEEAMKSLAGAERASLVERLGVQASGKPVAHGITRMTFRLAGLPQGVRVMEDDYQKHLGDGVYEIAFPAAAADFAPSSLGEEERAAYLASDPFVLADNAQVREAAEEATLGAESDLEKALALYDWVFQHIDKVPIISVPSAVDVLRTRTGDCNEHTVLYAAMARSIDLPCRIAIGLVYSDHIGGFGYHAWPEAYVGGWLPMAPTLGQPVCDATHVKLLTGGIEKWTGLVNFIGRIEMEILETEPEVRTENDDPA